MSASRLRLRRSRWLIVAVVAILVPTVLAPVVRARVASPGVHQTEVIEVSTTGDGTPAEAYVVERLEAEGDGELQTKTKVALSDVEGLDGSDIRVEDDVVRSNEDVSADAAVNVYFGGDATLVNDAGTIKTPDGERQLPVDVDIDVRFDGFAVDNLDDIKGKTGSFEMTVTVTNRSGTYQTVEYRDEVTGEMVQQTGLVFVPMTVAMGPWYFPLANWEGLTVEGGATTEAGGNRVVEGYEVLFPPATPGSTRLKVTGQVRNFGLNSARIVVTPGVGQTQAPVVEADAAGGGGPNANLVSGILDTYNVFAQLEEDLPAYASVLEGVIVSAQQVVTQIEDALPPFVAAAETELQKIHDALVRIQPDIQDLADVTSDAFTFLGQSNYSTAICKPGIDPSLCTFDAAQEPILPPWQSCTGANVPEGCPPPGAFEDKTRPRYPGPTIDGLAKNMGTGESETVTRLIRGQVGDSLVDSKLLPSGAYAGSLYNLATLVALSGGNPVDADLDGIADFPPNIFPAPSSDPGLYPTRALDKVVIPKGFFWPGNSVGGTGPAVDPTQSAIGAICSAPPTQLFSPQSASLLDRKGGTFFRMITEPGAETTPSCTDIPLADITLRDLFENSGNDGLPNGGSLTLEFKDFQVCQANLVSCDPGIPPKVSPKFDMDLVIDMGSVLARQTNLGINEAITEARGWKVTCTNVDAAGASDPWALRFFTWMCGRTSLTQPFPITGEWQSTIGDASFQGSAGIDGPPSRCFFPLGLFLAGAGVSLGCQYGLTGHMGTLTASGQAIQQLIWNPAWNFDNWYRGDAGYQVTDTSKSTGPRLSQILNILAFILERDKAMCPSSIVTSPPAGGFPGVPESGKTGSGTPRVQAPPLDTPCNDVLPADADPLLGIVPTDAVGALDKIIELLGNPSDLKYTTNISASLLGLSPVPLPAEATAMLQSPYPVDLASALPYLVTVIDGLLDDQIEGTLVGGLDTAVEALTGNLSQVTTGVQATGLFVAQATNEVEAFDLNTALIQRGLELAKDFEPFMGVTTFDRGKKATVDVVFVFDTPGTTTEPT